jgi:hypothetical protein
MGGGGADLPFLSHPTVGMLGWMGGGGADLPSPSHPTVGMQ